MADEEEANAELNEIGYEVAGGVRVSAEALNVVVAAEKTVDVSAVTIPLPFFADTSADAVMFGKSRRDAMVGFEDPQLALVTETVVVNEPSEPAQDLALPLPHVLHSLSVISYTVRSSKTVLRTYLQCHHSRGVAEVRFEWAVIGLIIGLRASWMKLEDIKDVFDPTAALKAPLAMKRLYLDRSNEKTTKALSMTMYLLQRQPLLMVYGQSLSMIQE